MEMNQCSFLNQKTIEQAPNKIKGSPNFEPPNQNPPYSPVKTSSANKRKNPEMNKSKALSTPRLDIPSLTQHPTPFSLPDPKIEILAKIKTPTLSKLILKQKILWILVTWAKSDTMPLIPWL